MKKIIHSLNDSSSLPYRILNVFLVGMVLFTLSTIFNKVGDYYMQETRDFFVYESVEPIKEKFGVQEDIVFVSKLTRFKETDMRYVDTLFCGFSESDLFWYSQSQSEYNKAPAGIAISKWVYDGEQPTVPMVCKLKSAPYVSLNFGFSTDPQKIESSLFKLK